MLPIGEKEVKAREEMLKRMNIEGMLGPVQDQLDSKGYQGNSAYDLWRMGRLEQVSQSLGIEVPDNLPDPPVNRYAEAINMFRMALLPFVAK
jgi:hypothetical protein